MLKTGEQQALTVVKTTEFGVYLAEPGTENEKVLLPVKQVPVGTKEGDILTVFLYRDSEDRLIATTRTPMLTLGQIALLTVKEVGNIGAFLDWGLEKDLFLPFKEQTRRVKPKERILAALYLDKSGRLAATMQLYSYLKVNAPYVVGDEVTGIIYEDHPKFGLFTAIDNTWSALIPKKDAQGDFAVGDTVIGRVTGVREDGRLEITTKKKAYRQMNEDAEKVLEEIKSRGGSLPFDDHADPELINAELGLSKAAFKRAVGHLLKDRLIRLTDGSISLNEGRKGDNAPIKRRSAEKKEKQAKLREKENRPGSARDRERGKGGDAAASREKRPVKKERVVKPSRVVKSVTSAKELAEKRRFLKPSEKISLEEFYKREGM